MTASEEQNHHTDEGKSDADNDSIKDEESNMEKLPYPKSVFFIVGNEFCERFSYYGMRTILILYLTNILKYVEADAKIIYHMSTMFAYFFPILGAIVSDCWLGKFRTILYLSMIYACGSILLALTAAEPLHIPQKPFSIVALFLIAIGTGGIKPCVAAFGGDQFVVPQQELQLATFFSLFYFSINAGSLISTFLTPILREDVQCFGAKSCFPLAFAVPGVLMVVSVVIFTLGKPMYKIKQPKGNVIVDVVKCMWYAKTHKKENKEVDHWLDRSESKFGPQLVSDVKLLLKVLVLYIPLPIFWALYDQQGSAWTFQAVRMNGDIGFYTILPDQMQVVNPLLILAFIPLFTYGVYPLLANCHLLKKPLQRMCCGGFLAAVAFAVSAVLSMVLESTYPVLPGPGEAQLRIYDTTECGYGFKTNKTVISQGNIDNYYYVNKNIKLEGSETVQFTFSSPSNCTPRELELTLQEEKAYGIYLSDNNNATFTDNVKKSETGFPLVRTLVHDGSSVQYKNNGDKKVKKVDAGDTSLIAMPQVGTYDINGKSIEFKLGGTYTVLVQKDTVTRIEITEPNSVHILWLLPQYFIITAAEIMFSITGLEFSYSQASVSMKSVLQACFLLTTAVGNLLIVLIESAKIFDKQSNDFFLYTGLMVLDILIFVWLAFRYKPKETEETSESEELEEPTNKKELSNGVDNPNFEKN